MDPLTALFAAGALVSLKDEKRTEEKRRELRRELNQRDQHDDDHNHMNDPDRELQLDQSDALERLVDIKERNESVPESRDATQDGTITLDPNETAVIESTPERGYVLAVQRVYADRRDNHEYSIEIDGVSVSSIHEWNGQPKRRVRENGKVVVEITNLSGNTSVIDWVIDQEGIPSGEAPGR